MKAIKLDGGSLSLNMFADTILSEHVINNIDYRFGSVVALHYLFKGIEDGAIIGYAVINEERCLGIVWGEVLDNVYTVHAAFQRNVDTQEALILIEQLVVPEFKLNSITANIPESNKAAQFMFRRFGAKKRGKIEKSYMVEPGIFLDCTILTKEY